MEKVGLIILIVLVVVAAAAVGLTMLTLIKDGSVRPSPCNGMNCGNCRNRYPMSEEDLRHFPCKSKHRCSTDGTIIPDMSYWCPDYEKDKTYGS